MGNNQNQQFNQRNQQFNQQTFNSAFGNFASNGITEEQRQLYLPVMRALLKVMQTDRPSARDINTLMVETRDLNKKVPKGQNLLGNFANFGIDGLESMGLPEFGDIIENVDGIPHIRTTWGSFPLSDTSLMTPAERARFIKPVRVFTNILEISTTKTNNSTKKEVSTTKTNVSTTKTNVSTTKGTNNSEITTKCKGNTNCS